MVNTQVEGVGNGELAYYYTDSSVFDNIFARNLELSFI